MVASSITAIANLVLNAIFMPIFGYMAAGYTTAVCYILFSVAHYIFMRIICKRELSVKTVYDDKFVLLLSILYLIVTASIMLLYEYVIIRYSILIIAAIIAFIKRKNIIWLLSGLNKKWFLWRKKNENSVFYSN